MDLNDFKKSKFLTQADVGEGVLVTISHVSLENVAKEGAEEDLKPTVYFVELEKPLVCNSTNAQIIAKITGADTEVETKWKGAKVVLYTDPNVSFGGKITGGIRVRAMKTAVQIEKDLPF